MMMRLKATVKLYHVFFFFLVRYILLTLYAIVMHITTLNKQEKPIIKKNSFTSITLCLYSQLI